MDDLDYTNLFTCPGCSKLLPFGTKKCPICKYDFEHPEIEDRKKKIGYVCTFLGFVWFLWICDLNNEVAHEKFYRGSQSLGAIIIALVPVWIYWAFEYKKRFRELKNELSETRTEVWKIYDKYKELKQKKDKI